MAASASSAMVAEKERSSPESCTSAPAKEVTNASNCAGFSDAPTSMRAMGAGLNCSAVPWQGSLLTRNHGCQWMTVARTSCRRPSLRRRKPYRRVGVGNKELYGEKLDNKQILMTAKPRVAAQALIAELDKYSMRKDGR